MVHNDDDDFFYQPQGARGQRLDPAIGRMAMAAGGLSLIVIIVALGWSGFHGGSFGPPPVINPPATPLRVAPLTPGGLEVPGADVPIMSGELTAQGAPELAPDSATPDVAQLDQAAGINQPPPAASAPPAATTAAATPASASPGANASTDVQLAATPDEGSAEAAWLALQKKLPDLLGGKTPVILPAVVNGQSIWRLRLAGFANTAAAQAFCAQLSAKGAACTVAAF